jgi:hypothetical protein
MIYVYDDDWWCKTLLSSSYLIYQAIFFSDASLRSQDDDPAICLVCGRLFNAGEVFITMNSTYNNFYTDEILIIVMVIMAMTLFWLCETLSIQYDIIADDNDYVRS